MIASSCKSQTQDHAAIFIWDPRTYSALDKLVFHNYTVVQLEFSRNDEYLISVSRDRYMCLFKKDTECKEHPYKLIFSDQSHARIIWSTSFTHDTKYFGTGSRDKTVKIWEINVNEDKAVKICELVFESPVTAIAFGNRLTKSKNYVFTAGLENGTLVVCEFMESERKAQIKTKIPANIGHSLSVNKIKFRYAQEEEDKLIFASSADDNSIRVFEIFDV